MTYDTMTFEEQTADNRALLASARDTLRRLTDEHKARAARRHDDLLREKRERLARMDNAALDAERFVLSLDVRCLSVVGARASALRASLAMVEAETAARQAVRR